MELVELLTQEPLLPEVSRMIGMSIISVFVFVVVFFVGCAILRERVLNADARSRARSEQVRMERRVRRASYSGEDRRLAREWEGR